MASVVRRFLAALLGLMLAIIGSAAFADALAPLPVEEIAPKSSPTRATSP